MIILSDKNNIRSDLFYVFKKLYEERKITKEEYEKAVDKTIKRNY